MDKRRFYRRVGALCAALAAVLLVMGGTLYNVQVVNGDDYYQRSQTRIAETETVRSDRGDILDSSGQVLASNRTTYQVTLSTSLMGDEEARSATLLSLIQVARASGVTWTDTLPITKAAPFRFTTDSPYTTTSTDEDGVTTTSLTRLGKLAVAMKWIQDPTKEPVLKTTQTSDLKLGLIDRVLVSIGLKKLPQQEQPSQQPEQPAALPTAQELMELMKDSFSIGDMVPDDARAVAGVLYEVYLRSKDIYWEQYVFAKDVEMDFIARVKERSLSGVNIDPVSVRQYNTSIAAHLLGQTGPIYREEWSTYKDLDYNMNDTVGRFGAEAAFESWLRGTPGERTVERNGSGKVVESQWKTEPKPGGNVVLTIDADLQTVVERVLAQRLPQLKSKEVEGASCVILDVNDAGIKASASYPTFDLTQYYSNYTEYSTDPLKPLFNRVLQGLYAPGSTFKMITGIAGLEEGIITPYTQIKDQGRYTYYSKDGPMCWIYRQYGYPHGYETVSKAITDSCNYFFYEVGRQLGIDRLRDYAQRFGLGQKTGVELYEEAGILAGPEYTQAMGSTWYDGNTLSVAIGQESTQVTPIQLANYIATLVNGGTRYATHLLKEVRSSDNSEVIYTHEPEVLNTIDIAPQNLDAVKKGMLGLTTEGSVARYFRDVGVQVGAKTGSAQISAQSESNAVFVCFAPYDDPQIAMAIVVEHGGSGSELGAIAAEILRYYFADETTQQAILNGEELPGESISAPSGTTTAQTPAQPEAPAAQEPSAEDSPAGNEPAGELLPADQHDETGGLSPPPDDGALSPDG